MRSLPFCLLKHESNERELYNQSIRAETCVEIANKYVDLTKFVQSMRSTKRPGLFKAEYTFRTEKNKR